MSKVLSSVVLPACVPPATTMFEPADDGRLEEPRRLERSACRARPGRRGASPRATNLRMLTAQCRRVMSGIATCSRLPSGQRRVDERLDRSTPPTRVGRASARPGPRPHPAPRIVVVSSLRPARATNTRPGSLTQISSTARVVEVPLQRTESGHRVEHRHGRSPRHRPGSAARPRGSLAVLGDHLLDQQPHRVAAPCRVHPPAADQLADLVLDQCHGVDDHRALPRDVRDAPPRPDRGGLCWLVRAGSRSDGWPTHDMSETGHMRCRHAVYRAR